MNPRECANAECPYCFLGVSLVGKRVGMCGMSKPFIEVGCPKSESPYNTNNSF